MEAVTLGEVAAAVPAVAPVEARAVVEAPSAGPEGRMEVVVQVQVVAAVERAGEVSSRFR
jgi:hypothetical protein